MKYRSSPERVVRRLRKIIRDGNENPVIESLLTALELSRSMRGTVNHSLMEVALTLCRA